MELERVYVEMLRVAPQQNKTLWSGDTGDVITVGSVNNISSTGLLGPSVLSLGRGGGE